MKISTEIASIAKLTGMKKAVELDPVTRNPFKAEEQQEG